MCCYLNIDWGLKFDRGEAAVEADSLRVDSSMVGSQEMAHFAVLFGFCDPR